MVFLLSTQHSFMDNLVGKALACLLFGAREVLQLEFKLWVRI
jgi:hypothetical protein